MCLLADPKEGFTHKKAMNHPKIEHSSTQPNCEQVAYHRPHLGLPHTSDAAQHAQLCISKAASVAMSQTANIHQLYVVTEIAREHNQLHVKPLACQ
jgi:hypothetical protein